MAKILLGFMGAGKTTVGRILDPKFHDMDELIVKEIGMSINDYFAVEGEAAFRRREAEMLERLLENEAAIISLVAGLSSILITVPSWKKIHTTFICAWILKPCTVAFKMTKLCNVPLLNNTKEEFKKIFDGRLPLYEAIATHIVDVKDKTPDEIAGDYSMLVGYLGPKGSLPTMW